MIFAFSPFFFLSLSDDYAAPAHIELVKFDWQKQLFVVSVRAVLKWNSDVHAWGPYESNIHSALTLLYSPHSHKYFIQLQGVRVAVNDTPFLKIIWNKLARLRLCNGSSLSVICWQTHCFTANRSFGAVPSTEAEQHSRLRESWEKRSRLRRGSVCIPSSWWNPAVCQRHVIIFHQSKRIQSHLPAADSESFPSRFPTNIIYETISHHRSLFGSPTEAHRRRTHCIHNGSN